MKKSNFWISCLVLTGILLASASPAQAAKQVTAESKSLININSADIPQLTQLPRIGEKVAVRIVEYRKANGGFKRIQDLMKVKGIGEKTFERLKNRITV